MMALVIALVMALVIALVMALVMGLVMALVIALVMVLVATMCLMKHQLTPRYSSPWWRAWRSTAPTWGTAWRGTTGWCPSFGGPRCSTLLLPPPPHTPGVLIDQWHRIP